MNDINIVIIFRNIDDVKDLEESPLNIQEYLIRTAKVVSDRYIHEQYD